MTEAKHTPEPWPTPEYANDTGPDDDGFWEWWEIPGITKFDSRADADFAVRAVNCHDELVKALQKLLPVAINDGPGGCDGKTPGCPQCDVINTARIAIAKATGEA